MGPIYGLLVSSLDRYLAAVVNGIDDGEGAAVDEEGNLLGYELLLTRCFDFIEVLLDKNLQLKAMKQNLPQLFSLIIAYMQMSEDQAELWLNDSDQFVMDDSEVSLSGSLVKWGGSGAKSNQSSCTCALPGSQCEFASLFTPIFSPSATRQKICWMYWPMPLLAPWWPKLSFKPPWSSLM